MSRWIDIDDDRNCYCGCDGEYEKWSIDTDVLDEAKTDMVERKKGKWIGEPKDGMEAMFFKPKCSVCGFESAEVKNYCPNCGARMEEEDE